MGQAGHIFLYNIASLVDFCVFFILSFYRIFTVPIFWRKIAEQCIQIGFLSVPIVAATAFFAGAVLSLQSYIGFTRFGAEEAIPGIVIISMTRELGPVLVGLVMSGRIGSYIAAELGTMQVTEQIDGLRTLSVDSTRFLVIPRVVSSMLSLPVLVFLADILGVYGGYIVSVYKLGFNPSLYLSNTYKFFVVQDILSGLIKSLFFGFTIGIVGCFYGYNCGHGARGVGLATTNAVIVASISILFSNYVITSLLFHVL